MPTYSVATAKDGLSRLIAEAVAGERVVITRHGKPAVELRAITPSQSTAADKTAALEKLETLRATGPSIGLSSSDLLRRMREEGTG